MARFTLQMKPGVARLATPELSRTRWWDANNVRFRQGLLLPIGGNVLYPGSVVDSAPRDLLSWTDNSGQHWAAIGTDVKLWVFNFETQTLYDITPAGVPGLGAPANTLDGYGMGLYDQGLYGMPPRPRTGSSVPPPAVSPNFGDRWSMDTFGEDLLVVPTQDGGLYRWSPLSPGSVAAKVTGAPVGNIGVVVTDQRHVVLLGAGGDPRNIAWSAQEDPNSWVPAIDNLAGSKLLVTQSRAMSAIRTPFGVLIFTDAGDDVHLMAYAGPPFAYGITQIAAGCSPISPRAAVAIGSFVAWPGAQTFWAFNGNVQPMPCDVQDWFFSIINRNRLGRIFGSPNPAFSECWWDFPDEGADENNRYIAVNFAETAGQRPWTIGVRARTAAAPKSALQYPVLGGLSGTAGALYLHEYGWLENGQPRASRGEVYCETAAITGDGQADQRFNVTQIAFDVSPTPDLLGYEFFLREQASGPETSSGLYNVTRTDGLLDIRCSARHARLRVIAAQDLPWALGLPRFQVQPGGAR